MDNQFPNVRKLYSHDFVIKNSINVIVGSIIVLAGMYWADPSTMTVLPYITVPITLLGIMVFAIRYNTVTSTLRDGIVVKGKVESMDRYERTVDNSSSSPLRKPKRYSYFVNISYTVNGETYKKRFRLPNSGFVYDIRDQQEIELMLKETSPRAVLIKNVYINRLK